MWNLRRASSRREGTRRTMMSGMESPAQEASTTIDQPRDPLALEIFVAEELRQHGEEAYGHQHQHRRDQQESMRRVRIIQ